MTRTLFLLTATIISLAPGALASPSADTMALDFVYSAGADSFHWYRNDSIDGDTYVIDSMTTNTAAPFQIALEVQGTWDFTVHSATAILVYTVGSGTSTVSAGTLTLGDGYHIIYNDTSAGGSELHLDVPGPAASSSGSGSSSGAPTASNPLWDDIEADFAFIEWKQVDGTQQYRFAGNNAGSTLLGDLHQPGGTSDIDVAYIGDVACSTLSLPGEITDAVVTVTAGNHDFEAGTSGDGPWTLTISWGPHACPEDITGDGTVDLDDLLALITAWGSCP